ncbi:hypothetical protein [Iodidimonas sp. SYSU 1G8]|uniref:hypothetical protein n=1 Tax=Iodidimonas sp. SYSU 1G8 TaxID=3133967 RepID=UPI0031FE6E6E
MMRLIISAAVFSLMTLASPCGLPAAALADSATQFQPVEWSGPVPFVLEDHEGPDQIRIMVEAGETGALDHPSFHGEGCQDDEMMVLNVWRDGKPVHSDLFCSSYRLVMVRLYRDVKGTAFLALGTLSGHGPGGTTRLVALFEIGDALEPQGAFYAGRTVGEDLYLSYEYRVTRPTGGGLIVDTRAMNTREGVQSPGIPGDACCTEDLAAAERFLLGAARDGANIPKP